jgi:hypothetical protein
MARRPPCPAYENAKALGLPRYFTGERCRNGHLAKRFTSNKQCTQCLSEWAASPEGRASRREAKRKYNASHREQVREANRRRAIARTARASDHVAEERV